MKEKWLVCIEGHFDAAHRLYRYPGNCSRLHGHRWKVVVGVEVEELDELGMGIDFKELKSALKCLLEMLDHRAVLNCEDETCKYLQDDEVFVMSANPTAENLAKVIYMELKEVFPALRFVRVYESENAWVEYSME